MTEDLRKETETEELLRMTTDIVAAYVGNNPVPASQLSEVIQTVHGSLIQIDAAGSSDKQEPALVPAVPVKKSITPDYLICLEDGKKLKMLKRYLRTKHNLTPEEYRERWGLSADYPMVAPSYATQRSAFAKKIGLGKKKEK